MPLAAVRTPDSRFEGLSGYDFSPNYLADLPGFDGLRLHYAELNPDAEQTFLCLHGEPTWSYLYRKMAPIWRDAGHRVVMPDFFGFGRSDKPVDDAAYTFGFHRESLLRFVERLDLQRITLVVQDWGGLLGLTLPMSMPDRFSRLLIMNTTLATGDGAPSPGFEAWRSFMASQHDLDVGGLMGRAINGLTEAEQRAYDAPFVDATYKAGVRRFPAIVPTDAGMEGAAISRDARTWFAEHWTRPTFMAVGALDPVLGPPVMAELRKLIPGCPEPLVIDEGGHFVQEHGEPVARAALEAFGL